MGQSVLNNNKKDINITILYLRSRGRKGTASSRSAGPTQLHETLPQKVNIWFIVSKVLKGMGAGSSPFGEAFLECTFLYFIWWGMGHTYIPWYTCGRGGHTCHGLHVGGVGAHAMVHMWLEDL